MENPPLASTWPSPICDVGLDSGGWRILRKLCYSLCTIIMMHKGTSSYLQVGQPSFFLILLCIFDLCGAIRNKIFLVTSFSLPFSELSLVGLAIDLVD